MRMQVLNLDGGVLGQDQFMEAHRPEVVDLRTWGPKLRMGCSFRAFREFERDLARMLPRDNDAPTLNFIGSGDFHHVSLALVRRLREPFNLLVLDNHPDWMCGVPFLHCGTWLRHASLLPNLGRVFHVGGEVDFDNSYRWLAPWRQLRAGKIAVVPGYRRFTRGAWGGVANESLRPAPLVPTSRERVERLIHPFREELGRRPLYISLDKDVVAPDEAVVNWDSGRFTMAEIRMVIDEFTAAAGGRLAGMDVVGDWSPVEVQGWFRTLFHLTMHPPLTIDENHARRVNQDANLRLIAERCASGSVLPQAG